MNTVSITIFIEIIACYLLKIEGLPPLLLLNPLPLF